MMKKFCHFLAAIAIASVYSIVLATEMYAGDSNVKQLTSSTFGALVEKSPKPVLVEFYSPGCPHCVSLAPIWRQVAKDLVGHATVAAVNCQQDSLCSKYKVQGVPSIKLFSKDDAGTTFHVDYEESRSMRAIVSFAERHAISHVIKVSDAQPSGKIINLKSFLAEHASLPHAILFKQGNMVPKMPFKTLSVDFKGKLVLGITNANTDGEMAKQLGITLPEKQDAFVFIMDGKVGELYEGKIAFTELHSFIQQKLTNPKQSSKGEKQDL